MIFLLMRSCNLPHNSELDLWLLSANSLQKKLSLSAVGTLGISFFKKAFLLMDVHVENSEF